MKEVFVPIKKRNRGICVLQSALNTTGMGISYPQAVLIDRVVNLLSQKGDQTSIKELTELKLKWANEFLTDKDEENGND